MSWNQDSALNLNRFDLIVTQSTVAHTVEHNTTVDTGEDENDNDDTEGFSMAVPLSAIITGICLGIRTGREHFMSAITTSTEWFCVLYKSLMIYSLPFFISFVSTKQKCFRENEKEV